MELTISHEDGYTLATTSDPIDDSAGELFREYLHLLVGQPHTRIVLDLSASDRINSLGIAHLVSLAAHANTKSNRVVLAACSPFVSIVLSRCKLDRFFEMTDSVVEAVNRVLD